MAAIDDLRKKAAVTSEVQTLQRNQASQASNQRYEMTKSVGYKKKPKEPKKLPPSRLEAKSYLEKQKKKRDALDPKNSLLKKIKDNTVDLVAEGIDRFSVGETGWKPADTVGRAVNRFSRGMGDAVNVDGEAAGASPRLSTGSKFADKTADIAGNIAGSLTNPADIGGGVINKSVMLGRGVANRFAGKSNQFVRAGIEGAAAGAIQGGVQSGVRGETDLKELAANVGIGAATGGLLDPAAVAVGKVGRRSLDHLRKTPQAQPVRKPIDELRKQPNLPKAGISAFAKEPGPYENLSSDTKSQLTSRLKREPASVKGAADRLYTAVVDDVHAYNQFDKFTEKVLGRKLNPDEKTHQLALGTRGADVISNQILTNSLVDSMGNKISKSLKEALSVLPNGKFVDFEDYLVNKHAITRAGRDEKVFRDELNWTPEVGAAKIKEYESQFPEFKQAAEDVKQFQNNMLGAWLVDTGIISREQADAYLKANPDYVPMKRFFDDMEKVGGMFSGKNKNGFVNQSNPSKKYSPGGSQRKIISPIESMIENVDAFVKTAKRNQVMQAFVKNIQQSPEDFKMFAEIVEQPSKVDNIKGVDLSHPEGIEEVLSRMSEDFDRSMQKTRLDKDNIVRVLMDGQPVHVKINDKPLLEAVTALGPENGSKLLDAVGWLTNKMKVLTTGLNPVFSLTRNVMRDIPQSYIASKSTNNPLRFAADLFSSAIDIARNRETYQEFLNLGGGHSSAVAADRNLLAQSKRSILPGQGILKGIVPKGISKLENALNTIESAPRLAEFKRLTRNGEGFQGKLKGLSESQDITVNFKRRGRVTKELDKVFPYFNAAVQGLDKFARMYKDNPAAAITKSFAAITLPTMALYAWNHDNPEYQKLSKNVKDNFLLVPKGDGTFVKIAKPKEIGTVFSDIPERLMQMFYKEDPEAFKDFANQLRTTFTIPGIQGALKSGGITDRLSGVMGDTIMAPIADVQANKDFADRPIVPGYLEHLSPELQADARTSSVAKKVGELTGTSPKELDYLAKQYTGVIGQIGIPMLAPGSGNNPLQSLGNSLTQQVTADPVYTNDIMEKFYTMKEKYDQAKTDYSVTGKLPIWYDDNRRKELAKVNKDISEVRKLMRGIESDKSMSADSKRQKLRMMQEEMNKLAEGATKKGR